MTGDMKEPDRNSKNAIESKLNLLRKSKATPGSKKEELLQMLQNEYGVRFDMLKQYDATDRILVHRACNAVTA